MLHQLQCAAHRSNRRHASLALILLLGVHVASAQPSDTVTICPGAEVVLQSSPGFVTAQWGPDQAITGSSTQLTLRVTPDTSTTYFVDLNPPLGDNRVVNSDFGSPTEAFTSAYEALDSADVAMGQYTVVSEPEDINPAFGACRDIDRGDQPERMLMARGLGDPDVIVYQQTVPVEPNRRYAVAVPAVMLSSEPVYLRIAINGATVGQPHIASRGTCLWQQFYVEWDSGPDTALTLSISDLPANRNTAFAIDGITIAERFPDVRETFRVEVADTTPIQLDIGLCPGQTYRFAGQEYGPDESAQSTFVSSEGCSTTTYLTTYALGLPRDTAWTLACPGTTVRLNGADYSETGAACITLPSVGGCDSLVCEGVRFELRPQLNPQVQRPSCPDASDGVVAFTAAPAGLTIAWPDGSNDRERRDVLAGSYPLVLTTEAGCEFYDTVVVDAPQELAWVGVPPSVDVCASEVLENVVTTGGTGPVEVAFRQNQAIADLSALTVGTLALEARDSVGCSLDTTLAVTRSAGSRLLIGGPSEVFAGDTVSYAVSGLASQESAVWSFAGRPLVAAAGSRGQQIAFTPSRAGWLTVGRADGGLCDVADSLYVQVLVAARPRLFPTAFSPNGDGVNDVFYIAPRADVVRVEVFEVYDRWGNRLHVRTDCDILEGAACGWSGTSRGRWMDTGTYLYRTRVRLTNETTLEETGDVLLLAGDD